MKIRFIIPAICLSLSTGCKDFPDPSVTRVEDYIFAQYGQDQKAYTGEFLNDSLLVNVRSGLDYNYVPGMKVMFDVASGNGEVDHSLVVTDALGNAVIHWKLGISGGEQSLEASVLDPSGKLLAAIPFRAIGFMHDSWNTVTVQPDIGIRDVAADTINHISFAISNGTLYQQGERPFDWNQKTDLDIYNSLSRVILNNNLIFYLGTVNGKLYRSIDHGIDWLECTKPWTDFNNDYQLRSTSNNYLWATAFERPLRCSRDGGVSWQTDSTGLAPGDLLGDIYGLSDGTLFFLSPNYQKSRLYQSLDDGHTWTNVPIPDYSLKLYVTPDDELILINQENNKTNILKSIDKGAHFTVKYSVPQSYIFLPMDHIFYKSGPDYFVLIPGYGILHTPDFEQFDQYWMNNESNNLYLDDMGNFMVRSTNGAQMFYLER